MYRTQQPKKSTLKVNTAYNGETIEQKVFRLMNNKEPIGDAIPLIYQERNEGVLPEYDIKTDRFEVAIDAMDKVSKSYKAKREGKPKTDPKKEEGGAQSIQATENQ